MPSSVREHSSRCSDLTTVPISRCPLASPRSALAVNMALSTAKALRRHVMTQSPAPCICCGLMAMSPRASVVRRVPRWRRRSRRRGALTEGALLMPLSTSSTFAKPDDAFRAIVEAHRGLSDDESADFDAALVLILANPIGDIEVLRGGITLAER